MRHFTDAAGRGCIVIPRFEARCNFSHYSMIFPAPNHEFRPGDWQTKMGGHGNKLTTDH